MSAARPRLITAALLPLLFALSPAAAQNYIYDLDNHGVKAAPIKQANPHFPGADVRRGQEGWVRLNFVITPDGRATDPLIVDATGGVGFELAAREVLSKWQFEPTETTLANNTVDMRFEIYRGKDMATSNFLRRYRRIVSHLQHDEAEPARSQVDAAAEIGGWNLYETTMLCLMQGRVAGIEGNPASKLEHYRRALGVSNRNALAGADRRELLVKLFELQSTRAQYAAAQGTLDLLRKEYGSESDIAALQPRIVEMKAALASSVEIQTSATLYNPCDCGDGEPLWSHQPVRAAFSFSSVSGNVERFEVRCDSDRLQGPAPAAKPAYR